MKLYIIGNGFDIAHNLKTSYWDFRCYLEKHAETFLIEFEKLYGHYPYDPDDYHIPIDKQEECSQLEELSMAGTAVLLSALPSNGKSYENTNRLFEKCICKICTVEQELMKHDGDRERDAMMIYEVSPYISSRLGNLFYNSSDSQLMEFKISIEKLGLYAPNTCKWIMLRYKLLCENDRRFSHYWRFWSLLTEAAKKIAVELNKGQNYRFREEREMLLEYMYVNCPWQPLDYKNNPVKDGADCICEFAKDTMQNPIVYEGLASLMYNFPDSFLEKGLALHNHITLEELIANFNRSQNSAFYMENNIYTYVMNLDSNTIPTKIYKSCARILDALIKQSSSKAYYIRDYLLKSKKMV